jgi:hypothetical protein
LPPPKAKTSESYRFTSAALHKIAVKYQSHFRFGHVRFTPESAYAVQTEMSAMGQ